MIDNEARLCMRETIQAAVEVVRQKNDAELWKVAKEFLLEVFKVKLQPKEGEA